MDIRKRRSEKQRKSKTWVLVQIAAVIIACAAGFAAMLAADCAMQLGYLTESDMTCEKTELQIEAEKAIEEGVAARQNVDIYTPPMDVDTLNRARYEFGAERPELFAGYAPHCLAIMEGDDYVGLRLTYLSEESGQVRLERLRKKTDEIVRSARAVPTDTGKLLYVMRWLERNCSYTKTPTNMWDGTAYGCIVDGQATCAGFAEAFHMIMTQLGIPCAIAVDTKGEHHAWNIVKINGKTLEADMTKSCAQFAPVRISPDGAKALLREKILPAVLRPRL